MRDHTVTVDEVRAALTPPDVTVCSFSGVDVGRKQLRYQHSRAMFVVTRNGEPLLETTDIDEAVESYNSALRR